MFSRQDCQEIGQLCSMISEREHAASIFIKQANATLEECVNSECQSNGDKIIRVSPEELSMVIDFRQNKIEQARQELQALRITREQITSSLSENYKIGSKHE